MHFADSQCSMANITVNGSIPLGCAAATAATATAGGVAASAYLPYLNFQCTSGSIAGQLPLLHGDFVVRR